MQHERRPERGRQLQLCELKSFIKPHFTPRRLSVLWGLRHVVLRKGGKGYLKLFAFCLSNVCAGGII